MGVGGSIILKWIIKTLDVRTWTGLIWLRIGTSGELLCVQTLDVRTWTGLTWLRIGTSGELLCVQ
jgi:hypothetical protein